MFFNSSPLFIYQICYIEEIDGVKMFRSILIRNNLRVKI